jgi:hypothetical protein
VIAAAAAIVGYDVVHGPPAAPEPPLAAFTARVGVTAALPPWLPRWQEHVDTVAHGETLVDALARAGVSRALAARAVREAGPLARIPARAGSAVYLRALASDSQPAEITFRPEADRVVRLSFPPGRVARPRGAAGVARGHDRRGHHGAGLVRGAVERAFEVR